MYILDLTHEVLKNFKIRTTTYETSIYDTHLILTKYSLDTLIYIYACTHIF